MARTYHMAPHERGWDRKDQYPKPLMGNSAGRTSDRISVLDLLNDVLTTIITKSDTPKRTC